jgi:hypothetical protein
LNWNKTQRSTSEPTTTPEASYRGHETFDWDRRNKNRRTLPVMFCSSCGVALSQHLKYCNHCGAQLAAATEAVVRKAEKRLDEYLEGLFWLTVFGLGLILGGIALMQKLQVGSALMITYMVLSSAAFLVNFWLNLREVVRISGRSKEPGVPLGEPPNVRELNPMNTQSVLSASPSVTENTTRELEPIPKTRARI